MGQLPGARRKTERGWAGCVGAGDEHEVPGSSLAPGRAQISSGSAQRRVSKTDFIDGELMLSSPCGSVAVLVAQGAFLLGPSVLSPLRSADSTPGVLALRDACSSPSVQALALQRPQILAEPLNLISSCRSASHTIRGRGSKWSLQLLES